MGKFLKHSVQVLHDIVAPLLERLSDPKSLAEFQKSLGFPQSGPGATPPDFPDGSAMQTYLDNTLEEKDAILFTEALAEIALIIDALTGMYRVGAETYYAISPDDSMSRAERIEMAVSELTTLTINIFTLDYVRLRHPILHDAFMLAGVVDEVSQRAGGTGFLGTIIWDKLAAFVKSFALSDRQSVATTIEALGIGLNVLNMALFKREHNLFFAGGFETYPSSATTNADNISKGILSTAWLFEQNHANENLYLTLGLLPKTRAGGGFFALIDSPGQRDIPLSEHTSLRIEAEGSLRFSYASDVGAALEAGKANRASIFFKANPDPKTLSLLDAPELSVGYGAEHWVELRVGREEIGFIVKTDLTIKFGRGTAKSFPFGFLPDSQFEEVIPISMGWTTKRGWFVSDAGTIGPPAGQGAGGNSNFVFFNIPICKGFWGLTFLNVHLGVGKDNDTTIIETSLDFTFSIGEAFTLSVTKIGARTYIKSRDDNKGFLGQDIDLKAKPPTGIGMIVKTRIIKGGGFLSLDEDKGEYFGALELNVDLRCIKFVIKAFGIIQTKLPGAAEDEYALFVVISSDFNPISLVFGLTLNGVGGLFGHNRGANLSLIQSEMRSPSLENILFLKDPIANISRLVTDSNRYFPVEIGKSMFGFSLIIGYGGIFELRLSVIILNPGTTIVVPGFLNLATPRESKILKLQINFLGILDQQEGYLFFRADLVNSTLITFKLTGSLVFATGWGANTNGLFVLSIGGFHPAYKHLPTIKALPNAFTGLDRLRISFWNEGKNQLYLELYLAITSNSGQFGAHVYLHVDGPAGFNIDGHLGFDLLLEWDPKFHFEADIDARIDFRNGEDVLAGVSLTALFTGPTPKHIEGRARLKICWFLSVSIPFSTTWGDPAPATQIDLVDLVQLLVDQVNDDRNWRSETPDFHSLHVTLRNDPNREANDVLIHPLGALTFNQRELPLNLTIQKVGARKPTLPQALTINKVSVGPTDYTNPPTTKGLFAAGQFIELSTDEKLARPSFETMPSGVRITDSGASEFPTPFIKAKQPAYELSYIKPHLPALRVGSLVLHTDQFQRLSRYSAASRNINSWQSGLGLRTAPPPIGTKSNTFVVGGTDVLKAVDVLTPHAASQTEAEQMKQRMILKDPSLEGKIQVLAAYELTP